MKIIFLDIDGVVNSLSTKERAPSHVIGVEQSKIALVKQIVDATGAELVLSSTWREDWFYEHERAHYDDWCYLRDEFAKQGLHFIDYTPLRKDRHRGTEIKEWLEATEHKVTSYVVIDDCMYDIQELHEGHTVKTFFDDGLMLHDVEEAIKVLNQKDDSMK